MRILIVLIIVLFLSSCSDNGTEIDCQIQGGGIIDIIIADTLMIDKEYNIKIIYGTPDPCYVLQEVYSKTSDTSISFKAKICYQRAKNTTCPSVPVVDTANKRISFSKLGIIDLYIRDTLFLKKIVVI